MRRTRENPGRRGKSTRRTVWLSAEIREEIEDILFMLGTAAEGWDEIRIDAPDSVLDAMPIPETIGTARVISVPYAHAVDIRVTAKLRGVVSLFLRVVAKRPTVLVSGFSMMKHRMVTGILRVPHVAYIRGVVFDPEVSVGLSDKLRFGALRALIPRRVVSTYSADAVVTVGEVNKEFLVRRGISREVIHITGPIWLRDISPGQTDATEGLGHSYFVTGAWEAHGRMSEHHAQLELTRQLAHGWKSPQQFALRVHPRDRHDYEGDAAFADTVLDRSLPADFLSSLGTQDVLIAPLSTLAFEALFLGIPVVFYSDPEATKAYYYVYEQLGIVPVSAEELVRETLVATRSLESQVLSPIDQGEFSAAIRDAVSA